MPLSSKSWSVAAVAAAAVLLVLLLGWRALPGFHPSPSPAPSTPSADAFQKYEIADADARHGTCNDGSPAVYYVERGSADASTKWVIHLQGGGACDSVAGCEERQQKDVTLTTSREEPSVLPHTDGIMSSDPAHNPDFHDWNKVFVHYCSSDTWIGDDTAEVAGTTWQFNGWHIVGDLIEDLQNDNLFPENNLGDATEVLFTGSSAGSQGAQENADRVAEMLPNARVSAVFDSSWQFPIQLYGPPINVYSVDDGKDQLNMDPFISVHYDESCAESTDATYETCGKTAALAPYLTTPFFIYRDQRDPVLFIMAGVDEKEADAATIAYWRQTYRPALLASIGDLPGVFSPNVAKHTALLSDRFYDLRIDGVTFAETLGNWYFHRSGPTVEIAQ